LGQQPNIRRDHPASWPASPRARIEEKPSCGGGGVRALTTPARTPAPTTRTPTRLCGTRPLRKRKVIEMAIVSTTIVQANPGTGSEDILKQLGKAKGIIAKHGGENVTVLVNVVGGQGTNSYGLLSTSEDWATYGKVMGGVVADPDYAALVADSEQIATWENHVLMTLDI
jgi:hypothetical protein